MKAILEQLKKEYKFLLSGMGFGQKSFNFIGLDIGAKYFRAVRIKKTGEGFSVQDKFIGKIDELTDLPGKMSIKDDEELCVNFNLDGLIIKRLSLPMMPKEEIDSALKWELKEQVGFDIDKAKIKFEIIGEKDGDDGARKIDLITFVYNESDINPRVKQLKDMGLNVQDVMPLDFALARYASEMNIINKGENAAIVDIGSVKTVIFIIEDGKVFFTREIPFGGDTVTESMTGVIVTDKGKVELSRDEAENMKREFGIPQDIKMLSLIRPVLERLVSQIKSSLEYYEQYFNEQGIKKIILAGNGSRLKGLKEYISKETGLEILAVLPDEAGAIGLGLSRGFNMNMLPEEFRQENKKALKRVSLNIVAFILGAIFLFSYGLLSAQVFSLKKQTHAQGHQLESLKEIGALKDKIMSYLSAANRFSMGGVNAERIMKEISNIAPPDMALDRFLITNKEPNVKIGGVIPQQNSLTEFMSRLESSKLFRNVKLSFSEKRQESGQDIVSFEIICNLK